MKRAATIGLLGALAMGVWACVVDGLSKGPQATVFGATAVGAVAAHRALTGACWSSCPYGRVCDHDSGLCVERSCRVQCLADDECIGDRCEPRRFQERSPAGGAASGGAPDGAPVDAGAAGG